MRILLIDDDEVDRLAAIRALNHSVEFTFYITQAETGEEGLRLMAEQYFDAILLDFILPDFDGLQILHKMRLNETMSAAIIILSGYEDLELADKCLESGVQDFLLKDEINPRRLMRAIRHARQRFIMEEDLRKSHERVRDLAEQNLRIVNQRLEEARFQLLQSEKMAAIGQLAAGIAHEINNPISFVISNMHSLEKYLVSLVEVIEAYEQQLDSAQLEVIKQKLELDYVRSDAFCLMTESTDGLLRVKTIIQNLKNFAHVDETKWQFTDIHQGLDSTLNIVLHELKYKATIVKEYGELPEVECFAGEINQVFMNLLINAGQSIPEHGQITVRTGTKEQEVWIDIIDTGTGIESSILNRIFDPFFTTKPVGKGTGLGLSLSYNIIKKHQGRIEVTSDVGKGSTFRVWLPIKQNEKPFAII